MTTFTAVLLPETAVMSAVRAVLPPGTAVADDRVLTPWTVLTAKTVLTVMTVLTIVNAVLLPGPAVTAVTAVPGRHSS